MKLTERYKIIAVKELADMLESREFDKSVDFTFDDEIVDEPTGWFGVKKVSLFDEPCGCIAVGYYGGSDTIIRGIDLDIPLEQTLREMLQEVADFNSEVKVVCVNMEYNNGE